MKGHMLNNANKNFRLCNMKCPSCKGQVLFDEHHNEKYCKDCGLVMNAPKIILLKR